MHLIRKKRIERQMGVRGKIGVIGGVIGAGIGTVAGFGIFSSVGAIAGGASGFAAGTIAEGPKRKKLVKNDKNLEVSFIEK